MTKKFGALLPLAFAFVVQTAPSHAANIINVLSYDTVNGNSIPAPQYGDNSYFDARYTGTSPPSNSTTAGAALTGGTGLLTDGFIPTEGYGVYGSYGAQYLNRPNLYAIGQGPFIGWQYQDPTITFHLQPGSLVQQIAIYANITESGLAGPIGAIEVNGQRVIPTINTNSPTDPNAQYLITLDGALASETTFVIQLFRGPFTEEADAYAEQYPNHDPFRQNAIDASNEYFGPGLTPWLMVSEFEFLTAVPEMSTWGMMLLGLAGVGALGYRRRQSKVDGAAAAA